MRTLVASKAPTTLAILAMLACAPAAQVHAQGTVAGTITMNKQLELPNVVVFLDGVQGTFPAPDKPVEMNQHGLQFIPKVLPIVKGTTVNFLNEDPILHDVFSPDPCAEKLNLGTWPKDIVRTFKFANAGCRSVLLCNIHPGMEGWIVVFDHPFFAKPAEGGRFTIPNVPPGKYQVKTWHKKVKSKGAPVELKAAESVTVDLSL
ncbi:MAG: hypothetical protein HYY25_09675 [Candidatus Wallbacteria bacterium]|nr:hypothetical protein [Candidatus Wallbacteria bacterium]